jgi:hypothetical protein
MRTVAAMSLLTLASMAVVGCGTTRADSLQPANDRSGVAALPTALPVAAATPSATPVAVNCGPGLQALIRPSTINGQAVSQVECVPAPGQELASAPLVNQPYQQAGNVRYVPVSDVETMPVQRPVYRENARPASYRTAQYDPERPAVKRGRTWQKSAVIIGSSAGVGAGVGAAVGGKKGALIGAAIGGGGAAIWDQATRR